MPNDLPARDRLIVALDFNTEPEAKCMVDALDGAVNFYKVGWQLFFGTHFSMVRTLTGMGKKVFLDLKMSDIPQTVQQAIKNAPSDSVELIELMTLEGVSETLIAAKAGAKDAKNLKFLMLTLLSSLDDWDMKALYGKDATVSHVVNFRASRALDAGCDGLIASGESVRELREHFRDRQFIIVTPGIRPEGAPVDDHKRYLTPYQAIMYGADYLVVGRPITGSPDPRQAAENIVSEIQRGLSDRPSSWAQEDHPGPKLATVN